MMQQYDHKPKKMNEKAYYNKYDETSNDITNNSMFSAH